MAPVLPADLAPGDADGFDLVLAGADPAHGFRRRVVADAVIDGVTYQAVIDPDLQDLAPPSVTNVYAMAGFGRLFCMPDADTYEAHILGSTFEETAQYECTPAELAAAVAAAVGGS